MIKESERIFEKKARKKLYFIISISSVVIVFGLACVILFRIQKNLGSALNTMRETQNKRPEPKGKLSPEVRKGETCNVVIFDIPCHMCNSTGIRSCPGCNGVGYRTLRCSRCGGEGIYYEPCSQCGGSGTIHFPGRYPDPTCPYCAGRKIGRIENPCKKCFGDGDEMCTCSLCNGEGKIICMICGSGGHIYKEEATIVRYDDGTVETLEITITKSQLLEAEQIFKKRMEMRKKQENYERREEYGEEEKIEEYGEEEKIEEYGEEEKIEIDERKTEQEKCLFDSNWEDWEKRNWLIFPSSNLAVKIHRIYQTVIPETSVIGNWYQVYDHLFLVLDAEVRALKERKSLNMVTHFELSNGKERERNLNEYVHRVYPILNPGKGVKEMFTVRDIVEIGSSRHATERRNIPFCVGYETSIGTYCGDTIPADCMNFIPRIDGVIYLCAGKDSVQIATLNLRPKYSYLKKRIGIKSNSEK